ncbi:hypothetical protein [Rhizobium etli]|uniref:hypothetical protein n=1 Tax=Rhizobium etli TaxID=29449 RepID=UPI000A31EC64|nr:hypothetical protein [Rhizobium etli]
MTDRGDTGESNERTDIKMKTNKIFHSNDAVEKAFDEGPRDDRTIDRLILLFLMNAGFVVFGSVTIFRKKSASFFRAFAERL